MNYQILFWVSAWLNAALLLFCFLLYRETARITLIRDTVMDVWADLIAAANKIARGTHIPAQQRYHLLNKKMQDAINVLRARLSYKTGRETIEKKQ